MKTTAVIVVTYNRKEYLLKCIKALQLQSCTDRDIFIIDNASTDGTKEAIENFIIDNSIFYYNTGKNLGGAGGFNYGMRVAAELGYELLWIMDDDCIPESNALEQMINAHNQLNGDYGFLSGVAYWRDGSFCNMNIQKVSLKEKISDYSKPLIPVIMATFVSLLVKASTVKEMGLPIKEFFIWSDDLEYTRRISKKYKSYVVTDSCVLHDMQSNAKVNIVTESPDRLNRYSYMYRNEVYVYRREGLKGWIYLFERVAFHLAKIIFLAKSDRKSKILVVLRSFIKGLSFNPNIEYLGK